MRQHALLLGAWCLHVARMRLTLHLQCFGLWSVPFRIVFVLLPGWCGQSVSATCSLN